MHKVTTEIDTFGIATVTMANPDKHNAFDDAVIAELYEAFTRLDADDSVRIVVLAAQGKSFSAGADLSWMKRMASYSYEDNYKDAQALADMLYALNTLSKPTIARVQGAAYGGAVGLVSCCDMAIGTPRATFSLSEAKIGLAPATISPYVIDAIGQRASRRYFLTAERFDAQTALHLGLLSEIVEEDQLDTTIDNFINILLANSPKAITAGKKLIFAVANRPVDSELRDSTSEIIARLRVTEEGQEGLRAFLEKTKPNWIVNRPSFAGKE